jgi:HrpA-like RNA helicase
LESVEGSSINFCTAGLLIRRLHRTPSLDDITHIIIDEIHERDLNSDFLLILLKELSLKRKDLKIILMSATMEHKRFSDYFGNCPVIQLHGRSFPVETFYLEDIAKFAMESNFSSPSLESLIPSNINNYSNKNKSNSIGKRKLDEISSEEDDENKEELEIDYSLIVFLISYITNKLDMIKGSILVFLPGWEDITTVQVIISHFI